MIHLQRFLGNVNVRNFDMDEGFFFRLFRVCFQKIAFTLISS